MAQSVSLFVNVVEQFDGVCEPIKRVFVKLNSDEMKMEREREKWERCNRSIAFDQTNDQLDQSDDSIEVKRRQNEGET